MDYKNLSNLTVLFAENTLRTKGEEACRNNFVTLVFLYLQSGTWGVTSGLQVTVSG